MVQAHVSHLNEAFKLDAEGYADLYKIQTRPSASSAVLYLKNDNSVWWQGQNWEGAAVSLTGTGRYSDEKMSRPTFRAQNPDGIFSSLIRQGVLDMGNLTRYRVLGSHLKHDLNVFIAQSWWISRVSSLNRTSIAFELREQLDGANFVLPSRTFSPPEFPSVTIR